MSHKRVTFDQLQKVLTRLGYAAEDRSSNGIVFRHPDSNLYVILPRMRSNAIVRPLDLLSVQNTLANSGIVPKHEFESLFRTEPIELWHAIIDAEAEYQTEYGHAPQILKLPVVQAYDLAKLRREDFGPMAGKVMRDGIKVFEKEGLLGIPVELVPDLGEFEFE